MSGKETDQLMSTIMSKLSTELSLCFCWWVPAEKPSLASDNHILMHQVQFHLLTLQYTDLFIHSPRPICLSQGKEEKSLPTMIWFLDFSLLLTVLGQPAGSQGTKVAHRGRKEGPGISRGGSGSFWAQECSNLSRISITWIPWCTSMYVSRRRPSCSSKFKWVLSLEMQVPTNIATCCHASLKGKPEHKQGDQATSRQDCSHIKDLFSSTAGRGGPVF